MRKESICIAVSFDGSLRKEPKIVIVRTVGSRVTVTTWASGTRGGMNYIPNRILNKMFESSGQKVIEATMENGNEHI